MDHFSNADDDDHRWIIRNRTSVEDENERTREELLLDFCHWKCRNKKKMRESIFLSYFFFSPLFDPFLIYWSIYIYIPPLTLAKLYWPGPVQFSCLPLLLVWANVIITSCSSLSLSLIYSFSSLCGCVCVCMYVPNDDDYRFKSRVSYCTHKQSGIVSSQENVVLFSSLFFLNCNFLSDKEEQKDKK